MQIAVVAGARPNFPKVDPLLRALRAKGLPCRLVHTGQHYDFNMSDIFFQQLGITEPDVFLEVGSASHAVQTAKIMVAFEEHVLKERPSCVVVAGDVNSTIACSLVAAKLGIPVAHLEAGLRSFDWTMPEEINRVLTDRLSDVLLTPSSDADLNLKNEGIPDSKIFRVGNIMIDTLLRLLPEAKQSPVLGDLELSPNNYLVGTFHRPSNVDSKEALEELTEIVLESSQFGTFVLPLHPRTRKMLEQFGLVSRLEQSASVKLIDPLGYIEFLALTAQAKAVITDSGGLQEETTALNIPCLTVRDNTERPITVSEGTNELTGRDKTQILSALEKISRGEGKGGRCPELWDGRTAERCAEILKRFV